MTLPLWPEPPGNAAGSGPAAAPAATKTAGPRLQLNYRAAGLRRPHEDAARRPTGGTVTNRRAGGAAASPAAAMAPAKSSSLEDAAAPRLRHRDTVTRAARPGRCRLAAAPGRRAAGAHRFTRTQLDAPGSGCRGPAAPGAPWLRPPGWHHYRCPSQCRAPGSDRSP